MKLLKEIAEEFFSEKSNREMEQEAEQRRSEIRCQYYLDHPDELKPYGDRAQVVASATTSSHMFWSPGALKVLKNLMWAQVVLVLSLPVLFPLVVWNYDRQTISEQQTEWTYQKTQ